MADLGSGQVGAHVVGDASGVTATRRLDLASSVARLPRLGLRNARGVGRADALVGPDFVYTKAFEWEIRTTPVGVRSIGLPQGLCVELKYLDGDEFAHWTDPGSFATSWRNRRKRREWEVFNSLQAGVVPEGVVELTAPAGTHIVDYVTHEWLPRVPRPLEVGAG